ncbi:MAG: hypothetical protein ACRDRN_20390 [Sciscionella sp.]
MKRLFWLGVGVAAGVAASRKASSTVRKATPAGVAENLGGAVRELAAAIGAFGADVRAGMTERESELSEVVAHKSGMEVGGHHGGNAAPTADARARARRAGG